ncbi:MAG: hypothetical protein ACEY3L_10270 [Wolbachia sp.]|nr:hypothetical protein [Wolbachia endosymbiont (group A) of Tiphia femorata]
MLKCDVFDDYGKAGSKCRSTGMTSSLMEIALKSQCSYSYGMNRGMT